MYYELTEDLTNEVIYAGEATSIKELIERAVAERECLAGLRLDNVDLSNANLANAQLEGCLFTGVNLSGADLSNADLMHATFRNVTLDNVRLEGADMWNLNKTNTVLFLED